MPYQVNTQERIDTNIKNEAKILLELVPAEEHNNDLLKDTVMVNEWVDENPYFNLQGKIHIAKMGPVTGYVLPMIAPDGYTGPIDFLLAINTRGEYGGKSDSP